MDYQPTMGSKTSFNDVKGLDDVIVELQQIVHYFQNPEVRLFEFFMIYPSTLRLFLSFPRKIHVGILYFQHSTLHTHSCYCIFYFPILSCTKFYIFFFIFICWFADCCLSFPLVVEFLYEGLRQTITENGTTLYFKRISLGLQIRSGINKCSKISQESAT